MQVGAIGNIGAIGAIGAIGILGTIGAIEAIVREHGGMGAIVISPREHRANGDHN